MRHLRPTLMRRKWALVAAVAAVLLVVGAYGGYKLYKRANVPQVELAQASQDNVKVSGQDAMILTSTKESTGPRPLALVTHGYVSDERVLRNPYMAKFTQDLLDAGWVVASSEARGNAWGSLESRSDYVALHQHVAERFDVSKTVIVSVSMGAISGLGMVADQSIPNLAGWVGVNPVTDLEAMATHEDLGEKVRGSLSADEITSLSPLNLDLPRVPLFVYGSDTDTVTAVPVQAEPFVQQSGATFVACAGGHVSPDCFRAADVIRLAS